MLRGDREIVLEALGPMADDFNGVTSAPQLVYEAAKQAGHTGTIVTENGTFGSSRRTSAVRTSSSCPGTGSFGGKLPSRGTRVTYVIEPTAGQLLAEEVGPEADIDTVVAQQLQGFVPFFAANGARP